MGSHNTHCNLLPLLCDVLPSMDERSCRCAKFIANALDSDSDVVSCVARHRIYFGRMLPTWLLLEIWCSATRI